MKKILFALIGAAALFTFASCGSSVPVQDAMSASTGEQIEDMTLEKAAGTYELSAVEAGKNSMLTLDSYTTNVLVLEADGTYALTVEAGTHAEHKDGTYSISANGEVTFADDMHLASAGEKVVCNGEKLVASGALGSQMSLAMEYTKTADTSSAE